MITTKLQRRRAIRLRRQVMAIYSYLLLWLGVSAGISINLFSTDTPHFLMFGGVLLVNFCISVLVVSGKLDNVREAPLTIGQITLGVGLITLVIHYSNELEGGLLVLYFLAMMFGLFALSRKHLLVVSMIIMCAYTGHEIWHWHAEPLNKLVSISVGLWFILLLGLMWFVYIGGYIFALQESHREQRRLLQEQQDELEAQNSQLSEYAIRDSLTNLHNRRYLLEHLDTEITRHNKLDQPLQLAVIDLDFFKKINDTHGHHIGDRVLVSFADYLREGLRADDLIIRYGGEEFVVVFINTSQDKALIALQRLQELFSKHVFTGNSQFTSSFSAGIAQIHANDSASKLLQRADKALYKAKSQGRNLIVTVN